MKNIYNLLTTINIFLISYWIYQFHRINTISKIRKEWHDKRDPRFYKYDFDEMVNPNNKNIFGLKFPREKDYK